MNDRDNSKVKLNNPNKPKGKLWPIFSRLFKYMLKYKRSLILIIVGFVISAFLSLTPAMVVKIALDNFLVKDKLNYLIISGVAILFFALLQAIIDFMTRYHAEVNGQKVIYNIRKDVYSHLMDLSFAYYDNVKTGDILSRITSDAETLQTFLGFASVTIVSNMLFVLGVLFVMLFWSVELSILYLVFVPFIIFGIVRYAFSLRPANSRLRMILGKLNVALQEQLQAILTIKIFGSEKRSRAKATKVNDSYMKAGFITGKIVSFWMPYVFVFIGLSTALILWYGGHKVISGSVSIGVLSGFMTYMTMMMRPVRQTGMMINQAFVAAAAAERIFEVLDTMPTIKDSENAIPLTAVKGKVEYKDVYFAYDRQRPVLQGVSFKVEPGQMIAIIGPTGVGKSTMINLLLRFYDPIKGDILIDEHNIKDYTIASLRANIGVVLQQVFLFNASIAENIAFAKPDSTIEEIKTAAKLAQIDDYIMTLPDGYQTQIGERGMKLSGGQRQRIAIARTLLLDPPMLILDEPTASVDSITDESIMTAIANLTKGRTVFMIAHRLWTLKSADRILVLEKGMIIQNGTHEELISIPGRYQEIFTLQNNTEMFEIDDGKIGERNGGF
ncbi:MAG: ABC transporter ATP-binding protein [Erysipelotrichaceae bacterium]|nr:ABC transporter ATP-binding protein [Erysipelotrichaceae bacterium]MDD3924277.1 ABC transporter ATP-binding protein [Erysipelotrichaceae bacterium]MDD4642603.1 ABC transporter ATP-binding protein [Erysipelotrichaceae bacterium]